MDHRKDISEIATGTKRWAVGGNLKKQLTTKNIQENEAISNCKIE